MARRLPIVEYKGKKYFFDDRLRQIRNVNDPYDSAEFGEVDSSKMKLVEPEEFF